MPLYLSILKHVNTPTDEWGPKDKENLVGRYDFAKKTNTQFKSEDNIAFECNELHRF